MYISRFQISNYKSFLESPTLELRPGFNIISGQNNAGKTALLEALGLQVVGIPHRSLRTLPARDTIPNQVSTFNVSFAISPIQVKELLKAAGMQTFRLVQPELNSAEARTLGYTERSDPSLTRLVASIFSASELIFSIRARASRGNTIGWDLLAVPSLGLYLPEQPSGSYVYFDVYLRPDDTLVLGGKQADRSLNDLGLALAPWFQRHIYRFSAERLKIGRGRHGEGVVLAQDAGNLPKC
jgi:AAA domain